MKIYLVRHGETRENMARRHQPEDTPLTKEGREQAKKVAEYFKTIKPTHILTSNLVRAVETANIIGQECDLIPETNYRFVELARPKNMYGNHHVSLTSIIFYIKWALGFNIATKNGSESYQTLRERFLAAQEFLTQYNNDDKIVVVSHAVFISLFVEHLCRTKAISLWQAVRVFKNIITIPNGHVIALEFNPELEGNVCKWSVES